MHKQNLILLILLFLMLPVGLVTAAENGSNLQLRTTAFNQSYPGTVQASRQTKLAFRVGGPLIKVAVKPGDRVKKGQLLMQIDPRDFEDSIRVLEAQLAGAESQQDRARRDFDRAQTLFDQHVSATADFDRAKSAFDGAFSGVQIIKAQLQIARHKRKDTSLLAPYAGVITSQSAEDFEMVSSGKEVLEIQDISNLEVEIKLPENEIARRKLKLGEQVMVEFPAISASELSATLVEWNSSADPVTRTYALRFSFTAPSDYTVLPGMTAEVRIIDNDTRPSSFSFPEQKNPDAAATL